MSNSEPILRTVYLTPEVDKSLLLIARQQGVEKTDLISKALENFAQEEITRVASSKVKPGHVAKAMGKKVGHLTQKAPPKKVV